jgi:DNA-binding MarR family transcriptional regulator
MTEHTPDAVEAVRALARASRILERASGGLNLAHYRVLAAIDSGDQRASRIAARLALGRPTVSASVDSLCQRGLLTRTSADTDQRVAVLSLTDEGHTVLNGVEAEMTGQIDKLLMTTPGGERLIESLVWLGKAIDESMEQLAAERSAAKRGSGR